MRVSSSLSGSLSLDCGLQFRNRHLLRRAPSVEGSFRQRITCHIVVKWGRRRLDSSSRRRRRATGLNQSGIPTCVQKQKRKCLAGADSVGQVWTRREALTRNGKDTKKRKCKMQSVGRSRADGAPSIDCRKGTTSRVVLVPFREPMRRKMARAPRCRNGFGRILRILVAFEPEIEVRGLGADVVSFGGGGDRARCPDHEPSG
jgi:hypothetical protein